MERRRRPSTDIVATPEDRGGCNVAASGQPRRRPRRRRPRQPCLHPTAHTAAAEASALNHTPHRRSQRAGCRRAPPPFPGQSSRARIDPRATSQRPRTTPDRAGENRPQTTPRRTISVGALDPSDVSDASWVDGLRGLRLVGWRRLARPSLTAERRVPLRTQEGHVCSLTTQVANAQKPLMSVARMCHARHQLVLEPGGGCILHLGIWADHQVPPGGQCLYRLEVEMVDEADRRLPCASVGG